MAGIAKLSLAAAMAVVMGLAAMAGLAGCKSAQGPAKPVAVATIFAYYDALRAIGGPDVDCVILLPPKRTPHEYEPTVADRAAMARAGLIIKNGLQIDAWADRLAEDNKSAAVIDAGQLLRSKGLQPIQTEQVSVTPASDAAPAEDVSAGNPHIWLDPRVQAMVAEAIRDELIRMDPAHKEGYESRAKVYLAELDKLDRDFAAAAAGFKQRDFIGFHSAYAYLAKRYGLNQAAAVEELPGHGVSLTQQGNIIKLIREKHVKVIFMENALPRQIADRIIEETGVRTGILQPLETYDSTDQTYVSLMRANLAALKEAME